VTPNPDGSYSVSGSHTYAEEGSYQLSVSVKDSGSLSASGNGSATVSDAALTLAYFLAGGTRDRYAALGATFTDADPNGQISDYTATITWGDGHTSTVKVYKNPLGKGFVLAGLHQYVSKGTYSVTLTVSDAGGSQLSKTVSVTVK
jgi:PKD repeat protein